MNHQIKYKMIVNVLMTTVLLLLMSYQLIGDTLHEILGVVMLILFISHHILNWAWMKKVFTRKYNFYPIIQTIIVFFLTVTMFGSMVSGIILSKHIFLFFSVDISYSWMRILHHLSAYWSFIITAIHLGLHWGMILNRFKKVIEKRKKIKYIGILIAVYGMYAFKTREITNYLFLKNEYTFFDFNQSKFFFFVDYAAIMIFFVALSYYCIEIVQKYYIKYNYKKD